MSDFTDNKLNLANITALVTGASGRIGQRVAAELISAGARVRTVTRQGPIFQPALKSLRGSCTRRLSWNWQLRELTF